MLLLDSLETFTDDQGEAAGEVRDGHLFEAEGHQLDPAAMIEMIAQSAAAHEGYRRQRDELAVGGGFLAGIRDFEIFGTPSIGDSIRTAATRGLKIGDLQFVKGELKRGTELLARGELLFYLTEDLVPEAMPAPVCAAQNVEVSGGVILAALESACREWRDHGAVFVIDTGFPALNGHFPTYPILPAVLNVMMAVQCVKRVEGCEWRLGRITRAKFMQPVLPGSEVVVECEKDTERRTGMDVWRAHFLIDGVLAARLSFSGR